MTLGAWAALVASCFVVSALLAGAELGAGLALAALLVLVMAAM